MSVREWFVCIYLVTFRLSFATIRVLICTSAPAAKMFTDDVLLTEAVELIRLMIEQMEKSRFTVTHRNLKKGVQGM